MTWRTWRVAAEQALYGDGGFFHRPEGPPGHFRTSVTASPAYAGGLLSLAHLVDDALGRPDPFDVVDVGAGRGALLAALVAAGVPERWRLTGVELAARPPGLTAAVGWTDRVPRLEGLLVATEWLDDVPVDVLVDGRLVEVSPGGRERPGPPATPRDLVWAERFWPSGERVEVGHPRDDAWLEAVDAVRRGLAVAVDYGHVAGARPVGGTLTGFRSGQQVAPVPDGSCDVTTHVALDACASAGETAGADATVLTTQAAALRSLGLRAGRPDLALATADPAAYAAALAATSSAGALLDPAGLGGHGWLVQAVRCPLPEPLLGLPPFA